MAAPARVAVAVLAAAVVALPAASSARPRCRGDVAAVICAINAQRTAHGLRVVRGDRSLAAIARAHSVAMVARRRFAHGDFSARVARTAWARSRRSWAAGEALAWGTGELATPASTVAAWMASAEHRAILLDPRFRVVGVGRAFGVPVPDVSDPDGRTYTADFGT